MRGVTAIGHLPVTVYTHSESETEALGYALAQYFLSEDKRAFIALYGELGAGKTALSRGFVLAICPDARVKSPTYSIVNEYRGGAYPIFHFDFYRISDSDDLYSTGYYDYLSQDAFFLGEWSENILLDFPGKVISVKIEKVAGEENSRRIILKDMDKT